MNIFLNFIFLVFMYFFGLDLNDWDYLHQMIKHFFLVFDMHS